MCCDDEDNSNIPLIPLHQMTLLPYIKCNMTAWTPRIRTKVTCDLEESNISTSRQFLPSQDTVWTRDETKSNQNSLWRETLSRFLPRMWNVIFWSHSWREMRVSQQDKRVSLCSHQNTSSLFADPWPLLNNGCDSSCPHLLMKITPAPLQPYIQSPISKIHWMDTCRM